MNKFINKLIRNYLGASMDKSRDRLALSDKIYQKDFKDSWELEERVFVVNSLGKSIFSELTPEERIYEIWSIDDIVEWRDGI